VPEVRPRVRSVLFDLGGTLVDERDFAGWTDQARRLYLDFDPDDLAHAYQEVLTEVDAEPPSQDRETHLLEFWRRTLSRAAQKPVTESTTVSAKVPIVTPTSEITAISETKR